MHVVFSTWKCYFVHWSSFLEQHHFPSIPVNCSLSWYRGNSFLQCSQLLDFLQLRSCAWSQHMAVDFYLASQRTVQTPSLQWVSSWPLLPSLSSFLSETSTAGLRPPPGFPCLRLSSWVIARFFACLRLAVFGQHGGCTDIVVDAGGSRKSGLKCLRGAGEGWCRRVIEKCHIREAASHQLNFGPCTRVGWGEQNWAARGVVEQDTGMLTRNVEGEEGLK